MNMRRQTMRAVHARGPRSRTLILRDDLESGPFGLQRKRQEDGENASEEWTESSEIRRGGAKTSTRMGTRPSHGVRVMDVGFS